VAIKPVSTIGVAQDTASFSGEAAVLEAKGRHDPCVLPRAPPLLEGMAALVVMDAVMIQKTRAGSAGPVCSFATESRHRSAWNAEQIAKGNGEPAATRARK
jgi:chorismate synthase